MRSGPSGARGRNFGALLELLDPDVVLRADRAAVRAHRARYAVRRRWLDLVVLDD
ncbi:MAG: hypothetical protein ACRDK3_08715 [Actinomycetota bacterium]